MASFKKLPSGKVRAFVSINGHRDSKVLPASKARSWARDREAELSRLTKIEDDSRTFKDLFNRYAKEVSPKKRGYEWERKRLARFENDKILSSITLKKSTILDFDKWANNRLTQVKSSTVNRELNLLSNCLTYARIWQWMAHNPMKDLQRPTDPPHRDRRITEEEIEMMCHVLGFSEGFKPSLKKHYVALAFLFAIETAMRRSEICSLEIGSINFETRVAHLTKTKNGDDRDVPLTKRAVEILKMLPSQPDKNGKIFHLTPDSLDANFRKHRKNTPIIDLCFHDSRHEATTRLAKLPNMGALRLAKITGHKNLKYLMVYFNESAEDMVEVLDSTHGQPSRIEINQDFISELIKNTALAVQSNIITSQISNDESPQIR